MNARILAEVTTLLRQQQKLMDRLVNRPPAEKRVEDISMPKYDCCYTAQWATM
ncbi:hypothetical protein PC116_g8253 [Phytophthora cactorum]|uniref:Uncharacterized protein n=1 Tax=Phytophthora cactorum TaxID=29920 RepID=A0A8T1LA28_9STRA|nr:hypothetical protein Pcac1_g24517 [Phytophthora cactorum]KAG2934053.1 hypothetical protein PC114_g1133 [Phytophthora cactorum]KAG2954825.1 hypothetical protein PC117_g912 [Phytophthora cactorum]KAG2966167.1 hypothetical protein PC119_g24800 [Phytophthora cactorum]KAG3010685.1 hypothetical protein PC120_g14922 [Phytophthora cactorum]